MKPVRLGVLLSFFTDSLQRDLWQAVRRRAREAGVSTVAFLGQGLEEPELRHRTSTALYQLARAPVVDGLVVFSHNVGTHSGPGAVADLVDGLDLPAVSVGYRLPGRPSVLAEGGPALKALVDHLADDHGRRHFALVTGPEAQPESQARTRAVLEALAARGLDLDPALVADGQFNRDRAQEAARQLFSAGRPIDAVVCLNDHMAVGVLDYLSAQGVRVPEEVSVVGFDDLPESRWRRPALTTIRQPLEPQGAWAVDRLLARLGPGSPAPETEVLDCHLVVRRSCGCPGTPEEAAPGTLEGQLDLSDRISRLREIGVSLQGAFDLEVLAEQWALALGDLGFDAGDVVLYRGPVMVTLRWTRAQGLSRLEGPLGPLDLPVPGTAGPTDWVVLPLVYQDEFLGHLVLTSGDTAPLVYETLRDQMATAVKATALMEANLLHRRDLERQVDRRTQELREANRRLKDQIRQRQELEQVVQEVSNRTMQAIGQDIHDDLCQHLAGIGMLASVLEDHWQTQGAGPEAQRLGEIRALLDQAVDRAHQYSRTLYPPGLEQHGLAAALADLVDNYRRFAPHLQVTFQADGDDLDPGPQAGLHLYRMAQELVANASKHSGSELVLVRWVDEGDDWVLEVRDFGQGLPEVPRGDRMGLRILGYRAEALGARLVFQPLDPGLRVTCRLAKAPGRDR